MSFVDGEDMIEINERPAAPRVRARRRAADRAADAAHVLRRGRWAGSAPTARTCASAWSWSTSATALRETEFKVFRSVLDGGGAIRGINAGRARCRARSSTG
jgi:hypothetical protein